MQERPKDTIRVIVSTPSRVESIYTAPDQSIGGLRALVGARFLVYLDSVLLVYAGQILGSVGTLRQHHIYEGSIVHLVVKKQTPTSMDIRLSPAAAAVAVGASGSESFSSDCSRSAKKGANVTTMPAIRIRRRALKFLPQLESAISDPNFIREFMFTDPRMARAMKHYPHIRHALNSDANIREMVSIICNPVRFAELNKKRDLRLLRIEAMPGGTMVLARMNRFLNDPFRELAEFRTTGKATKQTYENPQLGKMNCTPLPNPWTRPMRPKPMAMNLMRHFSKYVMHVANRIWKNHAATSDRVACNRHGSRLRRRSRDKRIANSTNLRRASGASGSADLEESDSQTSIRGICELLKAPLGEDSVAECMETDDDLSSGLDTSSADVAAGAVNTNRKSTDSSELSHLGNSSSCSESVADNCDEQATVVDPEVRYHAQLEQLASLGYNNRDENLRALMDSLGDVNAALERLKTLN